MRYLIVIITFFLLTSCHRSPKKIDMEVLTQVTIELYEWEIEEKKEQALELERIIDSLESDLKLEKLRLTAIQLQKNQTPDRTLTRALFELCDSEGEDSLFYEFRDFINSDKGEELRTTLYDFLYYVDSPWSYEEFVSQLKKEYEAH